MCVSTVHYALHKCENRYLGIHNNSYYQLKGFAFDPVLICYDEAFIITNVKLYMYSRITCC